jgi:hypothetical protein
MRDSAAFASTLPTALARRTLAFCSMSSLKHDVVPDGDAEIEKKQRNDDKNDHGKQRISAQHVFPRGKQLVQHRPISLH